MPYIVNSNNYFKWVHCTGQRPETYPSNISCRIGLLYTCIANWHMQDHFSILQGYQWCPPSPMVWYFWIHLASAQYNVLHLWVGVKPTTWVLKNSSPQLLGHASYSDPLKRISEMTIGMLYFPYQGWVSRFIGAILT
jgi:hypothetical protein